MPTFRSATAADIDAICTLVNGVYRGDASRAGWTTEADFIGGQRIDAAMAREMMDKPDSCIRLACEADRVIGTIYLAKVSDTLCFAGMLAVATDIQSRGISRALMNDACVYARDTFGTDTIEGIVLSVRDDLIAMYQRMGFRPTGEVRPFPYGNDRYGIPHRDDLALVVMTAPIALLLGE